MDGVYATSETALVDRDDGVEAMGTVFRVWGSRKHSPPSERGVPPGGSIANGIGPSEQMERAAGGVLRKAVDACVHLIHPQTS